MATCRSVVAPAALSVVAALALFSEVWTDVPATGWGDYQEYHHLWEAARIAIERFGELPLWDPFQCGGITQYGNAQTQVFHPLFYLSLLTGTTVALKVFLTLHAALGIWGAYVFVRREERRSVAAAGMAALAWAGSGYFAWHCGTGHADFIAFYLMPWILVGWRRALVDLRWAILVGLVMSATVFAGGVYAFPFFVLLLGHQTVWALADPRRRAAVLPAGALAVLVTVLVGAFRLVPILADLEHHPRLSPSMDSMTLAELLDSLTWRTTVAQTSIDAGHPWVWAEYSLYLGFVVVTLALVGAVVVAVDRQGRWILSGAVCFAMLTLGGFASWAPWTWIHELPIYDSLKVPSRFGVLFTFYLVLLAARGLDAIIGRVRKSRPRLAVPIAAVIALIVVVDVASAHQEVLEGNWSDAPVTQRRAFPFFHANVPEPGAPTGGEDVHPASPAFPELNMGTGYCYSGMSVRGAPGLWAGRSDQTRPGPAGSLLDEGSSANALWATVELPRAAAVTFNRTWAPEWESSIGRLRRGPSGLMIVDAPRGVHRIELRYVPRTIVPALMLTLFGLFVCLVAVRRRPRRRWVWLTCATLGTALGLIGYDAMLGSASAPEDGSLMVHARASGYAEQDINDAYAPARAVDGVARTEWHARHDGEWLEIRSDREIPVVSVRLLNARNAPHFDRSTTRMRVLAWAGPRLVHESEVLLAPRESESEPWVTVDIGVNRVERIRLVVLGHRGLSGGLAEVELISFPVAFGPERELLVSSGNDAALRDGLDETFWTPDEHDEERWVELRYQRPTRIEGVSLRTADAIDVRVELFRRDATLGVVEHHVAGAPSMRWVDLPVRLGGADRLRLFVDAPGGRISGLRTY